MSQDVRAGLGASVGYEKTGIYFCVGSSQGKLLGSDTWAETWRKHRGSPGKEGGKYVEGSVYKGTKADALW